MNKFKTLMLSVAVTFTSSLIATDSVAYDFIPKMPTRISEDQVPSSIPNPNNVLRTIGKSSQTSLTRDLNVVVWNLYKGKNETFAKEFLAITKDADLVLAQEMYLDLKMTNLLLSKSDYVYKTATSFFTGRDDVRTGLFNSSKVLPLKTNYIRTQNTEPLVKTPKLTLISTYEVDGISTPLLVANIHGINFVTHTVFEQEIRRVFLELKKHNGPMIFAGDFNTWSEERLKTLNRYAASIGLKPTVFFPDNRMTFNGNKLDQFYHSSDIHITSAKAFSEFGGSDHTPLLVSLHILLK